MFVVLLGGGVFILFRFIEKGTTAHFLGNQAILYNIANGYGEIEADVGSNRRNNKLFSFTVIITLTNS